jgi:hypothetical protein
MPKRDNADADNEKTGKVEEHHGHSRGVGMETAWWPESEPRVMTHPLTAASTILR